MAESHSQPNQIIVDRRPLWIVLFDRLRRYLFFGSILWGFRVITDPGRPQWSFFWRLQGPLPFRTLRVVMVYQSNPIIHN